MELTAFTSNRPAIPAAKNALGDEVLYWLFARWSLWETFNRVWVQNEGPLPHPQHGPVLFYLNHSSWWDGYMMMVAHRLIFRRRFDSYVMMEEKQLRAFRFFTWCGAFSINRRRAEDVNGALNYATDLLRERPDRALYLFPQGKIAPNDQRPIILYPGIARIACALDQVTLCPIVFRYEFLGQQWPHAFIRVGPFHPPADRHDPQATRADITERLTSSADRLREQVVGGDLSRFAPLLKGRPGIDESFAGFLRLFKKRTPR